MVVDMLRNDLGRIAVPGSVDGALAVPPRAHPTLWQMSSTVRATTPETVGLPDIFRALFPCASVTGAPKVAAMSVISRPRGIASWRVLRSGRTRLPSHPRHRRAHPPALPWGSGQRCRPIRSRPQAMARAGASPGIRRPLASGRRCSSRLGRWMAPSVAALGGRRADRDHGLRSGRWIRGGHSPPGTITGPAQRLGAVLRTSACRHDIAELLDEAIEGLGTPTRVRLVLRAGGAIELETSLLDERLRPRCCLLCVDPEPVDSSEVTLFHKTTDRARYDDRARRHPKVG